VPSAFRLEGKGSLGSLFQLQPSSLTLFLYIGDPKVAWMALRMTLMLGLQIQPGLLPQGISAVFVSFLLVEELCGFVHLALNAKKA
jgi:hypothetical protein